MLIKLEFLKNTRFTILYYVTISKNVLEVRELNGLNLPTHDRRHQLRAKDLITQGANLVEELTKGLSNFFTYSEQRSKIYPADGVTEPLSQLNVKVPLFCARLCSSSCRFVCFIRYFY